MPNKIIEIKGADWLKGLSAHPGLAVGGLFQALNGCDPFESAGLLLPSITPDNQTLGTTPRYLTNWNLSGVGYIYAHTNTKLYQVLAASPYTVVDKSSSVDVSAGVQGAIVWGGRYIYAVGKSPAEIRSWNFAASDVLLLSGRNAGAGAAERPMCVGADGNLYIGDVGAINKCIINTGTTGNTIATTTSLQPDYDMIVRALVNDGRYLVAFADNNAEDPSARLAGSYKCRVYFWDMQKTQSGGSSIQPDVIYDIPGESYLISAKVVDGAIEFLGYNGLYVCNSASLPKLIRPYPFLSGATAHRPLNTSQVCATKGSLYWIDGTSTTYGTIAAYGNPITGQQRIFYEPYIFSGGYTPTCLQAVGNTFFLGTTQPGLFIFNAGSTRGAASMTTLDTAFPPHTYNYTKVELSRPLASGESVQVTLIGSNGQISTETQSYNASNPKQNLLFRRVPSSSNQPEKFTVIRASINTTIVPIRRVAVFGTPLEETEAGF